MSIIFCACAANAELAGDSGPPDTVAPPECSLDSDCLEEDAPICSPDATCTPCKEDLQCKELDQTTPLCAADGACVACRGADDCDDAHAPVCDTETRSCRACSVDAECASGVCDLEEGTCFPSSDVYVVDDGATCATGDGSAGAPFCTIDEALAAFVAVPRNFIAVRDGAYVFPAIVSSPLPAFVGTADAKIGPAVDGGDCLTVDTPARFVLRGFHFTGCDNALRLGASATQVSINLTSIDDSETGIDCRAALCVLSNSQITETTTGIRCAGGARCTVQNFDIIGGDKGVVAATAQPKILDTRITGSRVIGIDLSNSEAEVRDVTVAGAGTGSQGSTSGISCTSTAYCVLDRVRVVGSRGAGLVLANSQFEVYSSAILDNGTVDPTLSQNGGVVITQPGAVKTFQNNTVAGNRASGTLTAGVRCGAAVALKSSIVWGNSGAPLDAACTATYSDVDVSGSVLAGLGNIRLDPKLTSMTTGTMDEHLAFDSPCIDKGDPAGGPAADIDGQARPNGTRVDIGADERAP